MSWHKVPQERLDAIVAEVFSLPDTHARERCLQAVMMNRQTMECIEIAMYLRTLFGVQNELPTWQPLLNAVVELIRQRGDDLQMLHGMIPPLAAPQRNTGQLP